MCKITVFTPTYNRANTLTVVYHSLLQQKFPREQFEWLIIDDGSIDNTKEIVDVFIIENLINIRYIFKENGGVHTAWNYGVKNAKGKYFFRCDSDDAVAENALVNMCEKLYKLPDTGFAGICGLCRIAGSDNIVGNKFPADIIDSTGLNLRYKYKVTGEKAGCMKTDILRKFPLPEPSDVKFIYEGMMWNNIDKKFLTRFINEVYKVYTVNGTDSITKHINQHNDKRYYSSKYYAYQSLLNDDYSYIKFNLKLILIYGLGLSKNGVFSGRLFKNVFTNIKPILIKFIVIFSYPLFKVLYVFRK